MNSNKNFRKNTDIPLCRSRSHQEKQVRSNEWVCTLCGRSRVIDLDEGLTYFYDKYGYSLGKWDTCYLYFKSGDKKKRIMEQSKAKVSDNLFQEDERREISK